MARRRCPFPDKDRLTKAQANERALQLNLARFDGSPVRPYRCRSGGHHHHVGHYVPWRRRR